MENADGPLPVAPAGDFVQNARKMPPFPTPHGAGAAKATQNVLDLAEFGVKSCKMFVKLYNVTRPKMEYLYNLEISLANFPLVRYN